jgi:hypothetical protein
MTIKIAFTEDGTPWTTDYENLLEDHIVADIPENKAWWRLSYNTDTETVEVLYPTLTDTKAEEQQKVDRDAADAAAKLLNDANLAAAAAE